MEKETVHLFVFDTLADWETGFAIAGINNPAFQTQPGRYQVKSVAVHKEPVKTIGGVTILPDMTLDELEAAESAMLILPGGETWDQGENGEVVEKARVFLEAGVPVAAICGATAGLARAGLLDNKAHTSNAPMYLQATGYRGEALYQMETAVTDQNLITASAIAPVDFAYHIFKKLEVYTPDMLEAWRGLYKTGDPAYFAALMESGAKSDAN
jgi:putative intracellular protease/amidase